MRRLAFLLPLLLASPGLRADPAETPFLVFREPDPDTRKRIEKDLIAEKRLAGRAPDARRETREEIARIGPWCVPFLASAIRKESSARIRLNAVLALAMIRDPRGLPALREAAEKDGDINVRRAATLAYGLFERDFDALQGLLRTPRAEWRSAAPALARIRSRDAAAILEARSKDLPKDEHDAAAVVLAAAIAGPDPPPTALLEHRAKLVQEAAAAGLAVRPLPPQRAGEIIAVLGRSRISKEARVLAIRALGAIEPRPAEAQAALLDLACKGDGDAQERIAAALELQGTAEEFNPVWNAYRKLAGRNDPVVAALMLALARTRETKAVETLVDVVRRESDFLRFYAATALLAANGSAELDEEVRKAVTGLRDVKICQPLVGLAQRMKSQDEAERKAAARKLRDVEDPRNLRLCFPREERNWHEANRLLTRIFELDEVLNQFDSVRWQPESPLGGGARGRRGGAQGAVVGHGRGAGPLRPADPAEGRRLPGAPAVLRPGGPRPWLGRRTSRSRSGRSSTAT